MDPRGALWCPFPPKLVVVEADKPLFATVSLCWRPLFVVLPLLYRAIVRLSPVDPSQPSIRRDCTPLSLGQFSILATVFVGCRRPCCSWFRSASFQSFRFLSSFWDPITITQPTLNVKSFQPDKHRWPLCLLLLGDVACPVVGNRLSSISRLLLPSIIPFPPRQVVSDDSWTGVCPWGLGNGALPDQSKQSVHSPMSRIRVAVIFLRLVLQVPQRALNETTQTPPFGWCDVVTWSGCGWMLLSSGSIAPDSNNVKTGMRLCPLLLINPRHMMCARMSWSQAVGLHRFVCGDVTFDGDGISVGGIEVKIQFRRLPGCSVFCVCCLCGVVSQSDFRWLAVFFVRFDSCLRFTW